MAIINKVINGPDVLSGIPLHQVKITLPDGNVITGSLQEGIQISYDPQYSTVSDLIPMPSLTAIEQQITAQTGKQLFNGVTTQKQYTGASYIDITVNVKVLDEQGKGTPLKYAKLLGSICQPIPYTKEENDKYVEQFSKAAVDLINDPVGTAVGATVDSGKYIAKRAKQFVADAKEDGGDAFAKQFAKQRQVNLDISDYLSFKEMVITNVSQSFSYEQGFAGPLFADFAITLSTLRVPDSTDVLNFYKDSDRPSRVSIGD